MGADNGLVLVAQLQLANSQLVRYSISKKAKNLGRELLDGSTNNLLPANSTHSSDHCTIDVGAINQRGNERIIHPDYHTRRPRLQHKPKYKLPSFGFLHQAKEMLICL